MFSFILQGTDVEGEPLLCEASVKAKAATCSTSSLLTSTSDFCQLLLSEARLSHSSLVFEHEIGNRGVLFPTTRG